MVSIDSTPTETELKDQATARVAGADTCKQGPNGLATGWSSEELTRTVETVGQIADGWTGNGNAVKVLRVLCELSQEYPERLKPGPDHDAWGFEASDIGERLVERFKISGAVGWKKDQEKARRRMNEYWTTLEEAWNRQYPTIIQEIEKSGSALRPRLERLAGGGTGKKTRYGFGFDDQNSFQPQDPSIDLDLLHIPPVRYRQKDISGNRLVRWMSEHGFYLGGWGGRFYFSVNTVLIVTVALWAWLSLIAINAAPTTTVILKDIISTAVILGSAYLFLRWQIRLINDRVARAPFIFQPWSKPDDYLLELRKAAGAERNTMYLIRYVADCPLCGDEGRETIRVESGRREFSGRLVGRCNRAPNAHVFSFDHVTRAGRFLR